MLNGVCTDRLGEATVHLDAVLRCTSFDDALRDDLLGLVDIFTSGWVSQKRTAVCVSWFGPGPSARALA